MIDILILYILQESVHTMYGIRKGINDEFSSFTLPSYGTIKPALKRLADLGYINSQKTMSKGGRPSVYYSITQGGKKGFKELLLGPVQDNPVQFLNNSRIKLYCSEVLDENEIKTMLSALKLKAESIYLETKRLTEENKNNFYKRIVYDNLNLEYKNFISLLEGIDRAGRN